MRSTTATSANQDIEPLWTLGLALLSLPVFILTVSLIGFAFGLSMNAGPFWIGVVMSLALIWGKCQGPALRFKQQALVSGGFIFVLAISIYAANAIFDSQWDGLFYHKEFIILLHKGWNPIWQTHSHNSYFVSESWDRYFAYFKGYETVASAIYAASGHLESGKALHGLMYVASLILSYCFFKILMPPKEERWICLIAALTLASNPVVVAQFFTDYIDGDISGATLSLVSALGIILLRPYFRSAWNAAFVASLYLMSLKVYAIGNSAVIWITVIAALFCFTKNVRLTLLATTSFFVLTFVSFLFAYNPIVIGAQKKHNCFYIFKATRNLVKHTWLLEPKQIKSKKNWFDKLTCGLSSPIDYGYQIGVFGPWFGQIIIMSFVLCAIQLVINLTKGRITSMVGHNVDPTGTERVSEVLKYNTESNTTTDNETAPLDHDASDKATTPLEPGPGSGKHPLARAIEFFSHLPMSREQKVLMILTLPVLLTVILNPFSWWSRYVPQLWFVPVLVLLSVWLGTKKQSKLRLFSGILASVSLLTNILVVAIPICQTQIIASTTVEKELRRLRRRQSKNGGASVLIYFKDPPRYSSIRARLKESGVRYKIVPYPPRPKDHEFQVINMPLKVFLSCDDQ